MSIPSQQLAVFDDLERVPPRVPRRQDAKTDERVLQHGLDGTTVPSGIQRVLNTRIRSARRDGCQSRSQPGTVLADGADALVRASHELPQTFARCAGGSQRCAAELEDDLNRPVREDALGAFEDLELMTLDIDLHERHRARVRTADLVEPPAFDLKAVLGIVRAGVGQMLVDVPLRSTADEALPGHWSRPAATCSRVTFVSSSNAHVLGEFLEGRRAGLEGDQAAAVASRVRTGDRIEADIRADVEDRPAGTRAVDGEAQFLAFEVVMEKHAARQIVRRVIDETADGGMHVPKRAS